MKSIINQIFDIAKSENISQKNISEASGVSVESLSRGKRRGSMTTDSIERIARALGHEIHFKKMNFPKLSSSGSVWSSPTLRNDPINLAARLCHCSFKDLVDLSLMHGIDNVESTMCDIQNEIPPKRFNMQRDMLINIKTALGDQMA